MTINDVLLVHIPSYKKYYNFSITKIDKKISFVFSKEHLILIKHMRKCTFASSCLCRPNVRNYNGFCDSKNCTNKWKEDKPSFVKVKDVKVGDAVMFTIPKKNNIDTIQYSYEWRDAPRSKPYIVNSFLKLNSNVSWLLGLYIAEGSTAKTKCRPVRLIFSLSKDEKDLIQRASKMLQKISGKKPTIVTRGNCTEIILCDSRTARIFNSIIPGNLYHKRVPIEFYRSSKENKLSLLFGFMLGDGTVIRNTLIGTTANQMLAFDLYKLSMYSGIPAGIVIRNTRVAYEVMIHAFHLRNIDISNLMYKSSKFNFNFKRQPNVLSWSDSDYIYSIIKNKTEVKLDKVYDYEVDTNDTHYFSEFIGIY